MGCDIHAFTEVKIKGEWHTYSALDIKRHYALFGKMAGVRDREIKPIAEPRGLPDDIAVVTRLAYEDWEQNAHSMSWLTAGEMNEVEKYCQDKLGYECWRVEPVFGYLMGDGWGDVSLPDGIEEARIVFWFDN